MKLSFKILFFTSVVFLVSCSKVCDNVIRETSDITNMTGTNVRLELCKVPYEQVSGNSKTIAETRSMIADFDILANQAGAYEVDAYSVSLERGNDKKCALDSESIFKSQVFLTAESFALVKLCRNDLDPGKMTIVTLGAGCAAGTTAQPAAVTVCNETALID